MKVAICSLGCKVNIYESEYVISKLKENGYEIVPFNSLADIYIINTCTVTNTADNKSEKMIRQARKNKDAIVVVMGCHSQIKGNSIDADIIIGNKDKSKIIELLEEYIKNKKEIKKIYDLTNESFEDMEINDFNSHTRAFVKIQDGCDAFCAYCIIPYSRGNIRSKNENLVIEEVTNLVNRGYKEIVLTGIHTGKYGRDINTNLENLLKKLIKIPNLYRLRISSIEINEITNGIIEIMKNSNIIAHHLHIPLQSGSDKILKLMERKYDTKYFFDRINYIRKNILDLSITTDLIVGFPYEDDNLFNETINFLNKIKFSKIHVFPYSKREGTKACTMDNQVSQEIKKIRTRKVIELSNDNELEFYKSMLNKEEEIITESYKNGYTKGFTSNYILVHIKGKYDTNKIIKVKIDKVVDKNTVIAKLV